MKEISVIAGSTRKTYLVHSLRGTLNEVHGNPKANQIKNIRANSFRPHTLLTQYPSPLERCSVQDNRQFLVLVDLSPYICHDREKLKNETQCCKP